MKKFLITSLIFLFITTPIYATHNHSDDCYNRVEHIHTDSCYTTNSQECGWCSNLESTEEIENCSYCDKPLYRKIHYAYVCCNDRTHIGNTFDRTYIIKSSWEDISHSSSTNSDGSIWESYEPGKYRHNCSNKDGIIIRNEGFAISGLPGPTTTCTKLIEKKELTCEKQYDVNELICNTQIKSIKAKTQYQTSKNPDFTLVITYKDESTKEVQPKMTTFTNTATYAKDSKIIAYYQNENDLEEIIFYITTPTPTPTKVATPIPTQVVTPTPTKIITPTPTPTKKPTTTPTPTKTITPTIEPTPIIKVTNIPTPTITQTPIATPTPTKILTPTITPTKTPQITSTPTNIVTPTPLIEATVSNTSSTLITPTPTNTENSINKTTQQPTKYENENTNIETNLNEEEENNTTIDTGEVQDTTIENNEDNQNKNIENEIVDNNKNNNTKLYIIIGLVIVFVIVISIVIIASTKKKNNIYW